MNVRGDKLYSCIFAQGNKIKHYHANPQRVLVSYSPYSGIVQALIAE